MSDTRVFPLRRTFPMNIGPLADVPAEPATMPQPAEGCIHVGDAARCKFGRNEPVLAIYDDGKQVGFMTEQELREVLQHMQAMQQQVTA